jgi:DNA repair protein RAD50
VHQDESNWPLDDAKTVKKKFDAIFNLAGYTKAADAMSKVRLHNKHEIDKHKMRVGHLETFLKRLRSLKYEISKDEDEIEKIDTNIRDYEEKGSEAGQAMKELQNQIAAQKGLGKDLEIFANKLGLLEESNKRLFEKIDEGAEENIEELVALKESMGRQLEDVRLQLKAEEGQLQQFAKEEAAMMEKFRGNETLESRLYAEINVNKKLIREIRQQCEALASKYASIGVTWESNTQQSNESIMDIYLTMKKHSREKEAGLRAKKDALKAMEAEQSEEIQRAQTKVYQKEEKSSSSQRKKAENIQAIGEINKWKEEVQISEEEFKGYEDTERNLNAKLQDALAKQNGLKSSSDAKNIDAKLETLEQSCEQYRKEKDLIQEKSGKHVIYQEKSKELKKVKGKLELLVDTHREALSSHLECGQDTLPQASDLMARIQTRLETLNRGREKTMTEKNRLESKREALARQIEEEGRKINALKAECKSREASIGELEDISLDLSIEEICKQKEEKISKLSDKINHMGALAMVFTQYIKRTAENHACPACRRDFGSTEEEEVFVQQHTAQKNSIPQRLQSATETRDKMQESLDQIKSKASLLKELKEKKTELLDAEKRHNSNLDTISGYERDFSQAKEKMQQADDRISSVQRILQTVGIPTHNYSTTIRELETALKAEKESMGKAAPVKTLDEVKESLLEAEKVLKATLKTKEDQRAKLMKANEEVGSCERKLREHRDLVAQAQGNAVELKARLKEKQKLEAENEALDGQHEELLSSLTRLKAELGEIKLESGKRSAAKQKEIDLFEQETHASVRDAKEMKDLCEKLNAATEVEKGERELSDLQKEQEMMKLNLQKLGKRVSKVKAEIQAREQGLFERDAFARSIDDNIAYKKGLRECKETEAKISDLKETMGESPSTEEMAEKLQKAKRQYEAASEKMHYLRGSKRALVQKVDERKSEIESKEFKNVETDFEEESLALKRTTVANKDINAYVDALKKALISFHNKKMTNVNKTIKELWQKTYRNSDIDYIKIKYEDGARGSHNYRVVMVSGGTELDMRGRCSAGQRVLASIIIRLALAETFCIDCGILALDEPTTNLDEENARSLAVMLQEIINDRSKQQNFQLIVITHDEMFARMIGRRTFCEKYWSVHKNENQHSTLLMQDVLE